MCASIRFENEADVSTIKQFQERFNVDAKLYGWDGDHEFINCCLCDIDVKQFFINHPELGFYYENDEWWEK